jgi:hypothetical protein
MRIDLATCTYQEFEPAMGAAVRTTAGHPRFKLGYALAGRLKEITPDRPMLQLPQPEFRTAYFAKLDAVGLDGITSAMAELAETVDHQRLVLLCFDRLNKPGVWCHRTLFAEWWEASTGEQIPELGAHAPATLDDEDEGATA